PTPAPTAAPVPTVTPAPVASPETFAKDAGAATGKPTGAADQTTPLSVAVTNTPARDELKDAAKAAAAPAAASVEETKLHDLRYDRAGNEREAVNFKSSKTGGNNDAVALDSNAAFVAPALTLGGGALTPVDAKVVNERLARSNGTLRKLGADQNNTVCVVVCTDDPN